MNKLRVPTLESLFADEEVQLPEVELEELVEMEDLSVSQSREPFIPPPRIGILHSLDTLQFHLKASK